MTYTEFKNKWLGKGIDFDGKYGNQCVDVYRMYCKEVLNIPQSPPVVGAKDIWNNYLKEHFTQIPNTPEGIPKQGDVMIWGMAPYGHIGIVDSATSSKFTTFEQNWTELNGSGVTELRTHYYKNVLGWLRPNAIINDMTTEEKRILDFLKGKTEGDVRQAFGALKDLEDMRSGIDDLQKEITGYKKANNELADKVSIQGEEIYGLKGTISEQYKEMDRKNLEYGKLSEKYNILLPKYEELLKNQNLLADEDLTAKFKELTWGKIFDLIFKKLFIRK